MQPQQTNKMNEPEEEDLSAWGSMRNSLRDEYLLLLNWVKPDPDKNQLLEYLKMIYKLPILIFATLLSPIALVVLAFVFFATL
jgi:hypothetical protein